MNDYERRAELHRPRDPWHLGLEIRRLARQGYSEIDIGQMLGCAPDAIRAALALVRDQPEKAA